jgi:hypothetical protein
MNNKITVFIYGIWNEKIQSGCGSNHNSCSSKKNDQKGSSCSGCSSCGGCKSDKTENNTVGEQYKDLEEYIIQQKIDDRVMLEFLDLTKINVLDHDDIRILEEQGFSAPYTVIDGIVRYYGGISKELIYKDICELLE